MTQTGEQGAITSSDELSFWLLEEDALTIEELDEARRRQKETGAPLKTTLLELDILEESTLVDVVARRHHLLKAPARLHRRQVSVKALASIPQDLCWQYGIFPFERDRQTGRLHVAVSDPRDAELLEILTALTGGAFDLYIAGPRSIEKAIRKHYLDAWVEDSRREDAAKLRFFGYEGITHPGVAENASPLALGKAREVSSQDDEAHAASPSAGREITSAGPARPPKRGALRGERHERGAAREVPRADADAEMSGRPKKLAQIGLKAQGAVLAPFPAIVTPPEQAVVEAAPREGDLVDRVQRLEEGLALLLRAITEEGGSRLADAAARVKKLLG